MNVRLSALFCFAGVDLGRYLINKCFVAFTMRNVIGSWQRIVHVGCKCINSRRLNKIPVKTMQYYRNVA